MIRLNLKNKVTMRVFSDNPEQRIFGCGTFVPQYKQRKTQAHDDRDEKDVYFGP